MKKFNSLFDLVPTKYSNFNDSKSQDSTIEKMKFVLEFSLISRYLASQDSESSKILLKSSFESFINFFDVLDEIPLQKFIVFKNLLETALIVEDKITYLELMGVLNGVMKKVPFASKMFFTFVEYEKIFKKK
jgi:hypothetical protein